MPLPKKKPIADAAPEAGTDATQPEDTVRTVEDRARWEEHELHTLQKEQAEIEAALRASAEK